MRFVRILQNTMHNLTGAVRRGDVVEVPDDLADHWTGQHLGEEADASDQTHGVPHVQNDAGAWVPAHELDDDDGEQAEGETATVAEPTSGPLTGHEHEPTVLAPEPTPDPALEPTEAPVTPAPIDTPAPPSAPVPPATPPAAA
jgi:hypothetical protein